MSLRVTEVPVPGQVEGTLFLSGSIPDPDRWHGDFDPLQITDAVVAIAREFLTAGWRLVTAAHPTIAPLLLYVAAELPGHAQRHVAVYQSRLFDDVLPTATRRFEADGIARIEWTEAAEGDEPTPGRWGSSLEIMRHRMLTETPPDAAVFIGGMEGIPEEYALVGELRPSCWRYALGSPGGAARDLVTAEPADELEVILSEGVVYPTLARAILSDIRRRRQTSA